MAIIDPQIPVAGGKTVNEDPKIINYMTTLLGLVNGELDDENVKSGADLNGSKLKDATVVNAKLVDGTIENGKIKDLTIEGGKVKDATLTPGKLAPSFESILQESDSTGVVTETLVMTTSAMPAGTYMVTFSGAVEGTKNNNLDIRLRAAALNLCTARANMDGTGNDVIVPVSLSWVGAIGSAAAFNLTIQNSTGNVVKLRAGARLNAVRIG